MKRGAQPSLQTKDRISNHAHLRLEVPCRNYLNSSPQLRHLFGSLTNKNSSVSKQVNGAPITATRMAQSGTLPLTTFVELHRRHVIGGTTDLAGG
jgi:hypothetical protein